MKPFLVSLLLLASSSAVPFHSLSALERRGNPFPIPGVSKPVPELKNQHSSTSLAAHPWIPAGLIRNSSRSPCPLLNTLANHGFINRNGRSLAMSDFESGITTAINFSPDFAATLTSNAFHLLGVLPANATDTSVTIDLEDLNAHGRNEHDASLTRLDKVQGDTLHVQPYMTQQMLNDTVPVQYPSLNTSSMGHTRFRRQKESLAAGSPPLNSRDQQACLGEAGLVLLLIGEGGEGGDWDSRAAKKERVCEWFDLERFPKGWVRSSRVLELESDMLPLAERVAFWIEYWSGQ